MKKHIQASLLVTHPHLTWKQRKTCLKKSHEKVIKGYYYRVQHQHQPRFAKKTRQLVGALATQMIDEL